MKNDDGTLPLKGRTVVLGPNADTIPSGGGSGSVSPFSVRTVAKELKRLNKKTVALTDDILYRDITDDIYTDSTMSRHGFTGRYFKNQKMEGEPDMVRVDDRINFFWEYDAPAPDFPDDHFSVYWTGFYKAPEDALMKIRIGGDDGYRIIINGKTVTGDWGNHAFSSREIEYELKGGEDYNLRVDYFDNISSANIDCSLAVLDEDLLEKELKRADNVIYCTGFNGNIEGEGFDRSFSLPAYQQRFMNRIASINPNITVVLNAGGGVDFAPWIDSAKAILMAWYPGQEGGTAISEILTGKLSPSGKLPISIEQKLEDNPTHANYHENVRYAHEGPHVDYKEGIFTGYRGYDRNGIKPLFPFGYGLSYSSFEFSDLEVTRRDDGNVIVKFNLRNTGKQQAAEVAQVYVSDVECSAPRPVKELKGFEKIELRPGQSRTVEILLPSDSFMYYDINRHEFVLEPGQFDIFVGNSSDNLPLKASIAL